MLTTVLLSIVVLLGAVFSVALWLVVKNSDKKIASYKLALESNQKKLDHQTSRINILSRALPSLQALVSHISSSDNWQSLILDEARALVWADSAGYWRFSEDSQVLELELIKGLPAQPEEEKYSLEKGEGGPLNQAVKTLDIVIEVRRANLSEPRSVLVVPLVIGGRLRGVFRFVRLGEDSLSIRDSELMSMFVKQLAVVIENNELATNREKFYLELVQTLADILDSRDSSKQGQTKIARRLARGIAKELDLPEQFTQYLEYAALMHDIGKIAIDDHLLKKPGKLTPSEMEIVKKHPELGYKILSPVTLLAPVAPMVLYHQEWFNGKGYPEGLIGEEIPLGARIVAILDAWGAMTSPRTWRSALSQEEALKEIKKGAGTQFDPKVVEAFLAVIDKENTL